MNIDSGIFTTEKQFYRNIYWPEEDSLNVTKVPLIPHWRLAVKKDVPSEEEEEIEDISDEAYEKRHSKYEVEERKKIKKDKSYQREQFYHSRLKVSQHTTVGDPISSFYEKIRRYWALSTIWGQK